LMSLSFSSSALVRRCKYSSARYMLRIDSNSNQNKNQDKYKTAGTIHPDMKLCIFG